LIFAAAHCVVHDLIPKNWYLTRVRLGEWDRNTNPDCQEIDNVWQCAPEFIDIKIAKVFSHEFFSSTSATRFNDIALLKLGSTVVFTEFIRPICIDLESKVDTTHGTVTAIGFGKTETWNTSQKLMKAEIDIVSHAECRRQYRSEGRQVADSQICAIKDYVDTW
jgi:hypothetical protein